MQWAPWGLNVLDKLTTHSRWLTVGLYLKLQKLWVGEIDIYDNAIKAELDIEMKIINSEMFSISLTHSERRPQNIYSQEENKPLLYHQIGNRNFFVFITNQ